MREFLQVEGQRVASYAHGLGEDAGREAGRAGGDQDAHDPEPMLLPERGEGGREPVVRSSNDLHFNYR